MTFPQIPEGNIRKGRKLDNQKELTVSYGEHVLALGSTMGKIPRAAYSQNERCWITLSGFGTRLFPGRVCGHLTEAGVTGLYYVIKLDNFTYPFFEIRDPSLMSEVADGIVPAIEDLFNPDLPTPAAVQAAG